MMGRPCATQQLRPVDLPLLHELSVLFRETFPDDAAACPNPSDAYLRALLSKEHIIFIAGLIDNQVVGGLAAYEVDMVERARELHIYILAVQKSRRRQGIATALIKHLRWIATQRDASIIFANAHRRDAATKALYEKLGDAESMSQFAIRPWRAKVRGTSDG